MYCTYTHPKTGKECKKKLLIPAEEEVKMCCKHYGMYCNHYFDEQARQRKAELKTLDDKEEAMWKERRASLKKLADAKVAQLVRVQNLLDALLKKRRLAREKEVAKNRTAV